ncbi:Carbonic anhydrase [Gracilaria domingensis]|nr:Carbonic anhydrase [Gracilaria domingensis]
MFHRHGPYARSRNAHHDIASPTRPLHKRGVRVLELLHRSTHLCDSSSSQPLFERDNLEHDMSARTQAPPPTTTTPAADQVLDKLLISNAAYVNGEPVSAAGSSAGVRKHLAENGQAPKTIVIACADSRVSPEIIFRAGLGELFVIRNAGNVTWEDSVRGSVEYAVEHLNSKVIMVLGHSKCGAVAAATAVAKGTTMGDNSLGRHVSKIADGVKHVCDDERGAVEQNVKNGLEELRKNDVVRKFADVKLVGAVYDLASGQVFVLNE